MANILSAFYTFAHAAIHSFPEPKVLILGGSSKNSDFNALAKIIANEKSVRGLVLIGTEAARIKAEVRKHKTMVSIKDGGTTMKEIIKQTREIAKPGDIVLLSPACASFDMFKNYQDRGEQFTKEVKNLYSLAGHRGLLALGSL